MTITVSIQIVGLYIKKHVQIGRGGSVKDALDALQRISKGVAVLSDASANANIIKFKDFTYTPSSGPGFLSSMSVEQVIAFKSPRSNRDYPAGVYALGEQVFVPDKSPLQPHAVWQYYISDRTGTARPTSQTPPFQTSNLHDGDHVIWRQVVILEAVKAGTLKSDKGLTS